MVIVPSPSSFDATARHEAVLERVSVSTTWEIGMELTLPGDRSLRKSSLSWGLGAVSCQSFSINFATGDHHGKRRHLSGS